MSMSASSSKTLFSIKAEELKRVLRAAGGFMNGRLSLRRAVIYSQGGRAWLAATDAHRAIRAQLPIIGEMEEVEEFEIFVDKKMMRLLRSRDVRGPVTVSVSETSIRFAWDGGEITYPHEEGYFPDVHAVIDAHTSGVNECGFDVDDLAKCVTDAQADIEEGVKVKIVKVRIYIDSLACSSWTFDSGIGRNYEMTVERGLGYHRDGQSIYVDSEYLLSSLKALKVLRRNNSVISYTDERSPLRLSDYSVDDDTAVDIVIMPWAVNA